MELQQIRQNISLHGFSSTIHDVILRAVNRAVLLKILKGLVIQSADPAFLPCPGRYRASFLDESTLLRFVHDPTYELTPSFVSRALAKGDQCYAFLDGEHLASYSWYANTPTEVDVPGLVMHFDPRYVYMYKGFTHDRYRGQRLYAIGVTRALIAYLARGFQGMLAYVEWNNFSSLKACYRMGYSDFGQLLVTGLPGRYFCHSDAGCEPYRFRLAPA